jgi:hypothetical protein
MQFLIMAAPLLFHDERGQIFLKRNKGHYRALVVIVSLTSSGSENTPILRNDVSLSKRPIFCIVAHERCNFLLKLVSQYV